MPTLTFNRPTRLNAWTFEIGDQYFDLARTDPDAPKHRGLTMFAVQMNRPGVTVRPLRQMNGDERFSEVFLDEVRVPDIERIGAVGEGWKVALRSEVLIERAMQVYINVRVVHMTRTWMAANARVRKAPEPEGSGHKLRTDIVKESRC